MSHRFLRLSAFAVLGSLLAPAAAMAHPLGVPHADLAAGFTHPFLGIDHLVAMLAIGMWMTHRSLRDRLAISLAFSAALGLGGLVGLAGITIPLAEVSVAGTLVAIGIALSLAVHPWLPVASVAVALVGIMHGLVHGAELPQGASAAGYVAGFLLASFCLQALGIAIGVALQRSSTTVLRLSGTAVGALGLMLMLCSF
jgi:urease accessory protein